MGYNCINSTANTLFEYMIVHNDNFNCFNLVSVMLFVAMKYNLDDDVEGKYSIYNKYNQNNIFNCDRPDKYKLASNLNDDIYRSQYIYSHNQVFLGFYGYNLLNSDIIVDECTQEPIAHNSSKDSNRKTKQFLSDFINTVQTQNKEQKDTTHFKMKIYYNRPTER